MLSRLERATLVAVVVVGLLVLTTMVVAALRWQHIKAWVDAPAVLDAHRTMQVLDLPPGFTDDTTLTACSSADPVRCAWTDQTAPDALEALVGALRDAGLRPGPVVCDTAALREALGDTGEPKCGAPLELPGATAWAVAIGSTPVGGVPLGRTAVWVMWDRTSMSAALLDRLVPELDEPVSDNPPSPAEVAAAVPARYRFAGAADCVPSSFTVACYTTGELDASDLGADPVPALVAELTDAGLFVVAANADPRATTLVSADRYFRGDDGRRRGLAVVIRRVGDGLRGEVYYW